MHAMPAATELQTRFQGLVVLHPQHSLIAPMTARALNNGLMCVLLMLLFR
ncbi:hypothetical protein HNQ65_001657 [Prosthecobacter vanneervenii]|uniref:Uncharacterized protein n=1 Tax=Prosthecobacter vanneervenii TaxID=48466 RepID=A0A7W7Y9P0_9BACT|nr:hypothetical protein [Prosthecobacter vanneervenii]